jgi:Zn-dependent M28 family amino/carboxypeptidase
MSRTKLVVALALAVLVAFGTVGVAAAAAPTDSTALRNAVSAANIVKHEQEFQRIANRNGGTRVAGTPGYDASAKYVAGKLGDAGLSVTEQQFEFPYFEETGPATFERLTPTAETYVQGENYALMEFSGSGDVTGQIVPTNDIVIPPDAQAGTSNSGCEASDFPANTAGNVALVQRGTCDFVVKAENALAAGAVAVIIFNEGQEGRTDIINGTLGRFVDIPALDTTFAVGEELYNLANANPNNTSVHIVTQTFFETRTTKNVIADYPGGRTDRTVVVGAHLDSVAEGPGINDNGSGSAGILEIALQMRKLNIKPTNHVRFAFWGAEEQGLHGSTFYVNDLSAREQKEIAVNLNFDMIGSPNFVRFVYDGDGSAFGTSGPSGSGTVEDVFLDYYASQGLQTEPTEFDGRSDYEAFINARIPAGGLFSGAEEIKTPEQAAIYGGTAGVAYDPCYHQACDGIKNINTTALEQLADGAAHATLAFAQSGSAVSGTDKASNTAASKMDYKGPNAKK